MATVIDELVVTLGLDASQFKRDTAEAEQNIRRTSEAARKTTEQLETSGKRSGDTIRSLNLGFKEFLGLFISGAAIAGFEQFIRTIAGGDAAVGRMARNARMAPEDLSAFGEAAKRAGGNAQEAMGSVAGLAAKLEEYRRTGQSPMVPFLNAMGIDRSALTDVKTLMDQLAAWAGRQTDPAHARDFLAQFGLDQGTINAMIEHGKEWQKYLDTLKQHGVVSGQSAAAAQSMNAALADLDQSVTGLGRSIMTSLSPEVTKIAGEMSKWIDANKDWLANRIDNAVTTLANDFNQFMTAISPVITAVNDAARAFGGWNQVIEVMLGLWAGEKIATMLANIAKVVGIVGGANPVIRALLALAAVWAGNAMGQESFEGRAAALGFEKQGGSLWNPFDKIPHFVNPATGESLTWEQMGKRLGADPKTGELPPLPGATGGGGGPSGPAGAAADVRDDVASTLGVSNDDAAAITSNFWGESQGVADITEGGGGFVAGATGGYGLAQWTGQGQGPRGRRRKLEAWAASHNMDIRQRSTQLAYMKQELDSSYPNWRQVLANAKTPTEKATAWFHLFESGGDPGLEHDLPTHIGHAEEFARLPSRAGGSAAAPSVLSKPDPNAAKPPPMSVHIGAETAHPQLSSNTNSTDNSSQVTVGNVHVYTQANNSDDIAKDIGGSLRKYAYVPAMNTGLA